LREETVRQGKKEAIHQGREEPFVEGRRNHSSKEGGTIHRRKEEPILSNTQEETVRCRREEAVHQRKRPFVERRLFVKSRECHGLRSRVGTGWHFRTPVKPTPVTRVSRVLLGYENINKQPLSFSTTTTIHLNHPPPLCHHCHQQSRSTTAHANDTSHDATATRRAPAGLTPHRGDDVARQRYPPDVP